MEDAAEQVVSLKGEAVHLRPLALHRKGVATKKLHLPEQAVLLVAVSVHWDRTSCRDLLVQLLFCSLLCSQMMQTNNKQRV